MSLNPLVLPLTLEELGESKPLLLFLRHPVIIPPVNELDYTYKLEEKKNPGMEKAKILVLIVR